MAVGEKREKDVRERREKYIFFCDERRIILYDS
jgi:hypothetical protein